MKQVWVKAATCSCTRRTTASAELPTLTTAMPAPRSISELPSTSTSTPPPARSMKTGSVVPRPADTAALRRAKSACDFGPGIEVARRRSCGRAGPPGAEGVAVMGCSLSGKAVQVAGGGAGRPSGEEPPG